MSAKDLIEAETPKSVFQQVSAQGPQFQVRRLTPREIERLSKIIGMGPIMKRPIDDRFLDWGYIEYYDDDQHNAVVARPGLAKALFNDPEIGGAVGKEWLDAPYQRRGRIRRYEAEDPKGFIQHKAVRYSPADHRTVHSTHGTFSIEPDGRVAEWNPQDPQDADAIAMGKIVKFDLDEWRKYWNWEGELPGGFDILDLGYWLRDGMYDGPEDDWREEIKRMGQIVRPAPPGEFNGRVANPE